MHVFDIFQFWNKLKCTDKRYFSDYIEEVNSIKVNLYYILPFNLNQRYYDAICVWIRVLSLYLISHKNLLLANYNKLDDDDATGICTNFNKLLHSHGESKFHRIITEISLEKDLRFKKSFQRQ